VVGACNSGHDIAQDLYESGAEVTLVQRSSTYIMSQKYGIPIIFGGLFFEGGLPTPYADLLSSAYPWPVVEEFGVGQTKAIAELDRDLLDRLEAVGFKLNYGPNNGGLMPYALRNGGGYYINVGASELIADRKIAIAQGSGVARFTPTGIELDDGRTIEADLVVLATGYSNMRETARRLFGDVVADRCEPVLGRGRRPRVGRLVETDRTARLLVHGRTARLGPDLFEISRFADQGGACRATAPRLSRSLRRSLVAFEVNGRVVPRPRCTGKS
jgi:hypothetical protein